MAKINSIKNVQNNEEESGHTAAYNIPKAEHGEVSRIMHGREDEFSGQRKLGSLSPNSS